MKFLKWLRGEFPDITPAQLVSGIPIIAEGLHVFGVYDLSQTQQDSLSKMVAWAVGLIVGDAVIRVGRNVGRRPMNTTPTLQIGSLAAGGGDDYRPLATGTLGRLADVGADDDGEPGDDDQFPDLPVDDPAGLPEDGGEFEDSDLLVQLMHERDAGLLGVSVSGLSAAHRAAARAAGKKALDLSVRKSGEIDYTQGPMRWAWKAHRWFASKGAVPRDTDCSGWATWVLYQGLRLFHVRDVVNGASWLGGFTGTMLMHGKLVRDHRNIRLLDLAIYNGHVAVCIGGGYVLSHGSPGIHKLPLNYRDDLIAVRRYI